MRRAAAQWELEGPRITGPMTSLNMLTIMAPIIAQSTFGLLKTVWNTSRCQLI